MIQCADGAAIAENNLKKEDTLVRHAHKAVDNLDDKLIKKMSAWELKMQQQWVV